MQSPVQMPQVDCQMETEGKPNDNLMTAGE